MNIPSWKLKTNRSGKSLITGLDNSKSTSEPYHQPLPINRPPTLTTTDHFAAPKQGTEKKPRSKKMSSIVAPRSTSFMATTQFTGSSGQQARTVELSTEDDDFDDYTDSDEYTDDEDEGDLRPLSEVCLHDSHATISTNPFMMLDIDLIVFDCKPLTHPGLYYEANLFNLDSSRSTSV
jgi:hypothetical protein